MVGGLEFVLLVMFLVCGLPGEGEGDGVGWDMALMVLFSDMPLGWRCKSGVTMTINVARKMRKEAYD